MYVYTDKCIEKAKYTGYLYFIENMYIYNNIKLVFSEYRAVPGKSSLKFSLKLKILKISSLIY